MSLVWATVHGTFAGALAVVAISPSTPEVAAVPLAVVAGVNVMLLLKELKRK